MYLKQIDMDLYLKNEPDFNDWLDEKMEFNKKAGGTHGSAEHKKMVEVLVIPIWVSVDLFLYPRKTPQILKI
jgi:hypothetical protein